MDSHSRKKPVAVWSEIDSINNEATDAFVIILDGPGCSWWKKSGCTMCGYGNDIREGELKPDDLLNQIEWSLKKYEKQIYVKIFTSGSFLDTNEIPFDIQTDILEMIMKRTKAERILVESRPEYINGDVLNRISKEIIPLEIAIGLETSSDRVRRDLIHKGFTWTQYVDAGRKVINSGGLLKSYLLMKPPLMGEKSSIEDIVDSVKSIHREFSGTRISINPMNVQALTSVEKLFNRGYYRPPWLWSLLEALERSSALVSGETHLMSSPTGGGKRRGAHNCGKCDEKILDAIGRYSISNDTDYLSGFEECCRSEWKTYCESTRLDPISPVR
jgi:hypothetical protein